MCGCCCVVSQSLCLLCREDGCLESELEGVLEPHEVAAVAAVGPGGAPSFVLQVGLHCVLLPLEFGVSLFMVAYSELFLLNVLAPSASWSACGAVFDHN